MTSPGVACTAARATVPAAPNAARTDAPRSTTPSTRTIAASSNSLRQQTLIELIKDQQEKMAVEKRLSAKLRAESEARNKKRTGERSLRLERGSVLLPRDLLYSNNFFEILSDNESMAMDDCSVGDSELEVPAPNNRPSAATGSAPVLDSNEKTWGRLQPLLAMARKRLLAYRVTGNEHRRAHLEQQQQQSHQSQRPNPSNYRTHPRQRQQHHPSLTANTADAPRTGRTHLQQQQQQGLQPQQPQQHQHQQRQRQQRQPTIASTTTAPTTDWRQRMRHPNQPTINNPFRQQQQHV
ncbi:putative uncharacterized protein DDB_G0274435 [Drosophila obscura]|uniref:putative uncharacterized protein DDB_G0274435 n=1 Tax=Drosophila obscura TaxID=7282 RepID=UPI001BB1C4F2|nr:putative uncharacterized protein DDB_G0274435 [Drosophila obscura]